MTCSYVIIAECTSQSKASTCVRRSEENRGELEAPSERWRSYVAFFFPSLSFPPRPAALSSSPGSDGHDLTPHPTQSHCTTRHASKLDNASLAPSTAPLARLRCVARGARARWQPPSVAVGCSPRRQHQHELLSQQYSSVNLAIPSSQEQMTTGNATRACP